MPDRLDLPRRYRDQVEALLREHVPGVEVWAYGSRVTGESHDASDLDLVLRGPNLKRIPSGQLADLNEALEESNVPIIVQIHDWARLPESFHKEIERAYVVLVEKEETRNKWHRTTFGECAVSVRDMVQPTALGDTPYIGLEHIGEGTLALVGYGVASDVTSTKACFRKGDILFGKLRPYFRKVVRAPFEGVCSTDIWVVRPSDETDPRFLYYLMASQEFVDVATRGAEGTRMPRAQWEYVSRFAFLQPPLPEQHAIAHILGTLDDKIELNRRMNETLEEMARALFKSWFVDFDPVHAKMKGRDPGLPKHLVDLFPDRLMDSELGPIPEGWEVKALEQFIELNPRESIKRGTIAPYLNMAALPTSGPNPDDAILREYTSGTRFRNGDTLFARITPCLENGKTAFVQGLPKDTVGWGSTEFIVMRAIPPVTSVYPYLLARDPAFRANAIQSMTGTSGRQRARTEALAPYQVTFPSTEVWTAFALIIEPLFSKIHVNSEESRTLVAQRDALLPRLLSGKLQIGNVETLIDGGT